MSASTYDLIGQILAGPRPAPRTTGAERVFLGAGEPLPVLIGRILGPPAPMWGERGRLAA